MAHVNYYLGGAGQNNVARQIDEPTLELAARQAMRFDDAPRPIGNGQLEHRLGKINTHNWQSSGSIHIGPIRVTLTPRTT